MSGSLLSMRAKRAQEVLIRASSGIALVTVTVGCIPSHRMVHEGDTYFERCYAADFDTRVRPEQRESCWQAWLSFYTRHQPAHRVDYALRRIEAVQNGEPSLVLPGSAGYMTEPAGSELVSADAAVGRVAPDMVAMTHVASTMEGDAGPVENGCLQYCNQYEGACSARCHDGSEACFTGCARERTVCLHACY
jgi:hypothetical protein